MNKSTSVVPQLTVVQPQPLPKTHRVLALMGECKDGPIQAARAKAAVEHHPHLAPIVQRAETKVAFLAIALQELPLEQIQALQGLMARLAPIPLAVQIQGEAESLVLLEQGQVVA
jgi:hypothetical protein